MNCPKCGTEVTAKEFNFCTKCGHNLRLSSTHTSIGKDKETDSHLTNQHSAKQPIIQTAPLKTQRALPRAEVRRTRHLWIAVLAIVLIAFIAVVVMLSRKTKIDEAKEFAEKGRFGRAINELQKIPKEESEWKEARQLIDTYLIQQAGQLAATGDYQGAISLLSSVSFDSGSVGEASRLKAQYAVALERKKIADAMGLARHRLSDSKKAFQMLSEIENPALVEDVTSAKAELCRALLNDTWQHEEQETAILRFSNGRLDVFDPYYMKYTHFGDYEVLPPTSLVGPSNEEIVTFVCSGTESSGFEVGRLLLAIKVIDVNKINIRGTLKNGNYYRVKVNY